MGKMSWLHAVLSNQAYELGFNSIEEAQANGYDIVGEKLLETSERALRVEKEEQLNKLDKVIAYIKDEIADGIADIEKKNTAYELLEKLADVEKYIKERS